LWADLGYIRDKHFVLAERFADGMNDRLPELAAELVRLNVDVILANATPAALAASKATTTIPILFDSVSDPVQVGLADSLGHPGHNSTGLSNFSGDLGAKRLQLLMDMVPASRC
jgi:putative ABC transport system substrate-binding protein